MTPAEVAWKLYREGPGRYDAATELARGIAVDGTAPADEVARAGTLLFVAGRYDDASAARLRALEHGAAPQLLAYLDTACTLRTGSGRAARAALSQHLAAGARSAAHRHAVAGRHRRRARAVVAGRPPRRAVAPAGRDVRRARRVAPVAEALVPRRLRPLTAGTAGAPAVESAPT